MDDPDEGLSWLISDFKTRVVDVAHAIVVSADGIPLAVSDTIRPDNVSKLCAITSGLVGLADGAARMFDGGMVAQSLVEMDRGTMLVRAIGGGSHLAVLANLDCDMEVVVYEMRLLAEAVGHVLTPARRRALPCIPVALVSPYVGSVAGRNGDGPYLDLDREAWRGLRASTPMSLTAGELEQVRGLADPIQLSEVADIYLPLSRLLRLYFEASAGLRETVGAFLGQRIRPAPFIIAVAGSVAVGKSTTARVLRTLISQWPQIPRTELVTTDSFLYPNAVLERRGLANRKGFPESYDRRALLRFVQQVRAGAPEVTAPVYSHLAYDILPRQRQRVRRPDVLILEGINVLQPAPAGALALADFFDFSVYVDARADHIRQWFLARLHALRETAFTDPQSPFRALAEASVEQVDAFGIQVWKTINEVNLTENIQPTRARATLVLHKGADHAVTRVRLRRF